ncbi:MAG TPA: Rrf2 family transcriptional regulator [Bacteroidia bacterium]|jgi:Rrf2 family protein|nr:Rrf2 family transcriptional regulator [Bacteroidia bacterium]
MLSKSCEYGLRALLHVSLNSSEEKKIGIKEVAENLELPSAYLSKILQNLVRHNILQSTKGPNGGFYLNEKSMNTPVIRVVEVIDGLDFFHKCGMGLKKCSGNKPCPIHHQFMPYRTKLKQLLEEKTIGDLSIVIEKGKAFINN